MKLVVDNVPYFVTWLHDYGYTDRGGRVCVCEIYAGATKEEQEMVSLGTAICSRFDNYDKETGRKVSLTRALKAMGISRENRTLFWNAYFARKGVKTNAL